MLTKWKKNKLPISRWNAFYPLHGDVKDTNKEDEKNWASTLFPTETEIMQQFYNKTDYCWLLISDEDPSIVKLKRSIMASDKKKKLKTIYELHKYQVYVCFYSFKLFKHLIK